MQCSVSLQEKPYIQNLSEETLQGNFTEVYLCGIIRLLKPGGLFCITGAAADDYSLIAHFLQINDPMVDDLQGMVVQKRRREALMKYTSEHFKVAEWSTNVHRYSVPNMTWDCATYFDEHTINNVRTPKKDIDESVIDFYVQCINVWCRRQGGTPQPRVRLAKTGLLNWMSWMSEDNDDVQKTVDAAQLFIQQMDALEKNTIFLSPVHRYNTKEKNASQNKPGGHWNRCPFD